MSLAPELYLQIERYIADEISRQDLENWLVPHLEELLSLGSPVADLVGELELGLAEYSHGDVSEAGMKESLSQYLSTSPMSVRWEGQQGFSVSGSSAATSTLSFSPGPFEYTIWAPEAPTPQGDITTVVRQELEFADK